MDPVDNPREDFAAAFESVEKEEEGEEIKESQPEPKSERTESSDTKASSDDAEPEEEDDTVGSEVEGDEEETEESEKPPVEEPVKDRAPESWKPAAREHWAKIPSEVKLEIQRRERDTSVALKRSAEARKFVNEFQNTIRPFEPYIAAERSTPLAAVQNLMSTATMLRVGTTAQKAGTVAQIISAYGVDVLALAQILEGKPVSGGDSPDLTRLLDERLQPIQSFIQNIQGQQQQRITTEQASVQSEIDKFAADPKNEFFEDLREDMSIMISTAAQRGKIISLKDAYDRCAALDPEISKVVAQRRTAESAAEAAARMAKKKAASSSIRGTQGAGGSQNVNKTGDMRGDILAAMEKH